MKESTLELPATPEDVMRGVEHLEQFCREQQVPLKAIQALMLAVEEMASNVVNHAYQRDAHRVFRLTLQHHGDRFIVELRDHGAAFDPLRAAAPDLESDPDERDIGGLGIHLVRQYIDELHYARAGDENVLRMTKVLTPTQTPCALVFPTKTNKASDHAFRHRSLWTHRPYCLDPAALGAVGGTFRRVARIMGSHSAAAGRSAPRRAQANRRAHRGAARSDYRDAHLDLCAVIRQELGNLQTWLRADEKRCWMTLSLSSALIATFGPFSASSTC